MSIKRIGLGLLDTIVKVVFIVVIAMLITKYAKVAYNYGYHIFNQTTVSSGTGRSVTVTIGRSDGAKEIGKKLADVGLITDRNLFWFQELLSEYHGMEKPGTYELSTAMTPEEMLRIMSASAEGDEEKAAPSSAGEAEESAETEESSETEESNGG